MDKLIIETAKSLKQEIISNLLILLKINSEPDNFDLNRLNAPFGDGLKNAIDFFIALAKKDGFTYKNFDGYVLEIDYGNQNQFIMGLGHLDVVPALNGWDFLPYAAIIHNDKIFGGYL